MPYVPAPAAPQISATQVGLDHDDGLIARIDAHGQCMHLLPGPAHPLHNDQLGDVTAQTPIEFWGIFSHTPQAVVVGGLSASSRAPKITVRESDFSQCPERVATPTPRDPAAKTGCIIRLTTVHGNQVDYMVEDLQPQANGSITLVLVDLPISHTSNGATAWVKSAGPFGTVQPAP